jgi:transcriptional antiterminator RfaH
MPVLASEVDLFPFNLLEIAASDPGGNRQWWALYTRSRHEKELMRRLHALEVPYYGPMVSKKSQTPGGRVYKSWMPLFPGYVFIWGDGGERYSAISTNCVSRDIPVVAGAELVQDLTRLRALILGGVALHRESSIAVGARVRVRTGPFAGQEGVVLQRRGVNHLIVGVRFLQQGVSLQLDECELEPIG